MRKTLIGCILISVMHYFNVLAQTSLPAESFTRADTLRGTLSPLRTCYDINSYHLKLKVDISNKKIEGSNLFKFTATSNFNRLQFDLFGNLNLEKVVFQGRELPYQREYNAVFVEFPQVIEKGTRAEFEVYYSGAPVIAKNAPWDGGFIYSEDSRKNPWVGVACQGLGASSWWPCKDHQADEVDSMRISVIVPRGLEEISNGHLVSEVQLDGGWSQFNWLVSYPINNYNVTLNIGDYVRIKDSYLGQNGQLDLNYYVLRDNMEKAKKQFEVVKEMLQCFESWFGPYPFYNDGYKLIEAPYLGMEHQSAIAYGNKFSMGYLGKDLSGTGLGLDWDYIIVHESGHEWFGNNVTSKDVADMWIHESFTTYSESLFVECRKGKQAGIGYVAGERRNIRNDRPIIGPYGVNKEGSSDMYYKGASLLNSVRCIINNDVLWRSILRGINTEYGLRTTTTDEIIKYISERSGKNLTSVFRQYLYSKNLPELLIKDLPGGKISYCWNADEKDFDMPIRVKMPAKKDWIWIYPTNMPKVLNVSGGDMQVDEECFYIKVNRTPK